MSLFNIIRYPISNPPRAEEFAALLPELIYKWTASYTLPSIQTPEQLARWYAEIWDNNEQKYAYDLDTHDLERLRELIREWDEWA